MAPPSPLLPRRRLLQLAAVAGASALAGCRSGDGPVLLSARGALPPAWVKALPKPWRFQPLESPAAVIAAASRPQVGLLQLGDGWAAQLHPSDLQPFEAGSLLDGLDPLAAPVSRLFRPEGSAPLAYPWAFGTWVLLLRSRPDLVRRGREDWTLLLDPSLRGKLVLPSSPRLVIELALRQLGLSSADPAALEDGRLPGQVRRLRRQALALDERDGLNLLLAGDADAAVVTSQRALPLLSADPRLAALLPASGSPLWWSLLLQPQAATAPAPLDWLRAALLPPLLPRLLAGGWLPPLPRPRLEAALAGWSQAQRRLLLPPPQVLARCNSLVPFSAAERQRWQSLWEASAPEPATGRGR